MHNMYEDHDGDVYEEHRRKLEGLTLDELKVLNDFHHIRLDVITSLIEEKHQELGAIGELRDVDYIYLQSPLRYSRSPVRARSRSPRMSSVSISPSKYPGGYSVRTRSQYPIRERSVSPDRGSFDRTRSGSPDRAHSPARRTLLPARKGI